MVNRSLFSRSVLLVLILTLLCSALMTAQESSGEKTSLNQHLSWTKSEGALRYEVVITRANREVLRVGTENNFVDVQLSPGAYQMSVMVFDFLDRPAGSATTDFEVLMAQTPEITSCILRPFKRRQPLELEVEGRNFTNASRFFLAADTGNAQKSGQRIPAEQVQVTENGRRATFTVPSSGLPVANYRIVVENPGGLVATSEPIRIRAKR
jgi:hypothetical protein